MRRLIVLLLLIFAACAQEQTAQRGGAPGPQKATPAPETDAQRQTRLRKAEEKELHAKFSMPGESSIELMLVDYIQKYRDFNRQSIQRLVGNSVDSTATEGMSLEQQYRYLGSKMLESTEDRNYVESALQGLAEAITNTPNGDTFVTAASRRLRGLGQRIAGGDIDTYEDIIAHLCAVYLVSPDDREAIFVLMDRISQYVTPEITLRDETHHMYDALRWAGTAWSVVMVWRSFVKTNWRAFPNPRSMFRGVGKPLPTTPSGPEIITVTRPPSVVRDLKEGFINAFSSGEYRSEMFRRTTRGILENGKKFAKTYTLPGLIGAAIYALREGNDRYRPTKVDPRRLLEAIQRGAILALEDEAKDLEIKVQKMGPNYLVRDPKTGTMLPRMDIPGKTRQEAGEDLFVAMIRLQVLRGELTHFQKRAGQFTKVVSRADPLGPVYAPNARPPEDKKGEVTDKQLRDEDRARRVFKRQERLSQLYESMMTQVAADEAKRRGNGSGSDGFFGVEDLANIPVALPGIEKRLNDAAELLNLILLDGKTNEDGKLDGVPVVSPTKVEETGDRPEAEVLLPPSVPASIPEKAPTNSVAKFPVTTKPSPPTPQLFGK